MNNLLTKIAGDESNRNRRAYDKMIYFNRNLFQFGLFTSGYSLQKGMLSKKLYEWFNFDVPFTFSAWTFGSSAIYTGNNVIVHNISLGLNFTSIAYFQLTNFRPLGNLNQFKINVFNPFILKRRHITVVCNGLGSPNNCNNYLNGDILENVSTDIIVNQIFIDPLNNYDIATGGGVNFLAAGEIYEGSSYLDGGFCDLRFWDRALTHNEVKTLYEGDYTTDLRNSNLIARYPATLLGSHYQTNTPTGKCTMLDTSGNGNHMILENMGTTPNLVNFY